MARVMTWFHSVMRAWWPAALCLLAAACGSTATSAAVAPPPSTSGVVSSPVAVTPSPAPAPSPRFTLATGSSRYGHIIVDGSGRTLYLFDIETDGVPRCYGACAVNWPPFLAPAASATGPELNQALVATAARSDGTTQVAYHGHPLYYYVGDHAAGEIKCQAVTEFGGGWYVLDANGNKISTP